VRPFNFELSAQNRPHLRRDARARHLKSDIILRTLQQLTRSLRPPTSHTTPRLRRPAAPSPTASAWTSLSLSTSLRPHLCDQTVFFSAKPWRRPRQLNVHDPSSSRLHSRSTKGWFTRGSSSPLFKYIIKHSNMLQDFGATRRPLKISLLRRPASAFTASLRRHYALRSPIHLTP